MKRSRRQTSLTLVLVIFMLAILLNALFLVASAYMLLLRYGVMNREVLSRPYMPIVVAGVCVLVASVLAVVMGSRKVRPIRRLNDAMRAVSKGDFSVRLDEANCDADFKELIHSYNHMAEELSGIELFRSDFINNFSHEFKTPIVSIRGFARQLERNDLDEKQRKEYTHIILTESERLANMSSNILLLTKLENQQIVTDKQPYRLDEQLRNCILLLEKQWSDKELELDLQLDALTYNGNEEMMSHLWINLLGNAIKYSRKGGLLEVSCMRVQDFLTITVRDHGEGMTPETQARVFEKFYQGDSAHAAEGNGLGLSLVKRITELCGGKVTVSSVPDRGSTFSVYLPVDGK